MHLSRDTNMTRYSLSLCAWKKIAKQWISQNEAHDGNSIKRDIIAWCANTDVKDTICQRHLLFFACPASLSFSGNCTLISFWKTMPLPVSVQHVLNALPQALCWAHHLNWVKEFIMRLFWTSKKSQIFSQFSSPTYILLQLSHWYSELLHIYGYSWDPVLSLCKKALTRQQRS